MASVASLDKSSHFYLPDPDVVEAKKLLNHEFTKIAKIRGQVFWLLYPPHGSGENDDVILPHAELRVGNLAKGSSISYLVGSTTRQYKGINVKTREYDLCAPHFSVEVVVTPEELEKIEKEIFLDRSRGFTCADYAIDHLSQGIKEPLIPYPERLSPTLSTNYLLEQGGWRTGAVEFRSSLSNLPSSKAIRDDCLVSEALGGAMFIVAVGVMSTAMGILAMTSRAMIEAHLGGRG